MSADDLVFANIEGDLNWAGPETAAEFLMRRFGCGRPSLSESEAEGELALALAAADFMIENASDSEMDDLVLRATTSCSGGGRLLRVLLERVSCFADGADDVFELFAIPCSGGDSLSFEGKEFSEDWRRAFDRASLSLGLLGSLPDGLPAVKLLPIPVPLTVLRLGRKANRSLARLLASSKEEQAIRMLMDLHGPEFVGGSDFALVGLATFGWLDSMSAADPLKIEGSLSEAFGELGGAEMEPSSFRVLGGPANPPRVAFDSELFRCLSIAVAVLDAADPMELCDLFDVVVLAGCRVEVSFWMSASGGNAALAGSCAFNVAACVFSDVFVESLMSGLMGHGLDPMGSGASSSPGIAAAACRCSEEGRCP